MPPTVAAFAAWMAGSATGGADALRAADLPPTADPRVLLIAVYQVFTVQRYTMKKDLDGMLRSDPTALLDLEHPMLRGDVRRLHVLQHELQRACLTATLGNLPVAQRAGFILTAILGFTPAETATILGVTDSAFKISKARAERGLNAYLGPRCEHMNANNFCHCVARLGVALDRGFIDWPDRDDLNGDGPVESTAPPGGRDATELFATLPSPVPSRPSDPPF